MDKHCSNIQSKPKAGSSASRAKTIRPGIRSVYPDFVYRPILRRLAIMSRDIERSFGVCYGASSLVRQLKPKSSRSSTKCLCSSGGRGTAEAICMGSVVVCGGLQGSPAGAVVYPQRETGYGGALASSGVSAVLADEEPSRGRTAKYSGGNKSPDPRDQPIQPALGHVAHSRRTHETRHRGIAVDRRQVRGKAAGPTVSNVEDVPAKPLGWHCRDRLVRPPDIRFQSTLRAGRARARSALTLPRSGNPSSKSRVDCPTGRRGLPMGRSAGLFDACPGCFLCDVFRQRIAGMGIRDRQIVSRSPWQNGYVERMIGSIRRDLSDPSRFGQRYTEWTADSRVRDDLCDALSRRIASCLSPDPIIGKDRGLPPLPAALQPRLQSIEMAFSRCLVPAFDGSG